MIRAFDPGDPALDHAVAVARSGPNERSETDNRFDQAIPSGLRGRVRRPAPNDDLYAAISEGRRAIGVEHWLPLLYDKLDTIFDYLGDAPFVLDARVEDAAHERIALIADNYAARRAAYAEDPGKADYKPLPPTRLYLSEDQWEGAAGRPAAGAAHAVRGAAGR